MGKNGGVLTSPWSQTSGLSVAVIDLKYMSYPTYRQVVVSANALTTVSGWPPVPAWADGILAEAVGGRAGTALVVKPDHPEPGRAFEGDLEPSCWD